jgi:hypothetical protein
LDNTFRGLERHWASCAWVAKVSTPSGSSVSSRKERPHNAG